LGSFFYQLFQERQGLKALALTKEVLGSLPFGVVSSIGSCLRDHAGYQAKI